MIVKDGQTYAPLSAAAQAHGMSKDRLRGRRRAGLVSCIPHPNNKGEWLYPIPSEGTPEMHPGLAAPIDDEWQAVKELAGKASTEKATASGSGTYRVASLWDVHVPEADAFAFRAVLDFLADHQPDHIVLGGDFLELESCSMHGGNPNPRALVDEIKAGQKAIQRLRDACPNACLTYLEGNHETRLGRAVVSSIPTLDGALDLPSLLHLAEQGIEWVPYRTLWNPHINATPGKLAYTHGEWTNLHHAAKHLQMYGVSVRYGHTHRPQVHSRGFADGRVSIAIGSPCLRTLDPSWAGPHNGWLHGFGWDEFLPDGSFTASNVVMAKRRFAWAGKVYG